MNFPKWFNQETVRDEQDAASFVGGYTHQKRGAAATPAVASPAVDKVDSDNGELALYPSFSSAGVWEDRYPDSIVHANNKKSRVETRVVLGVVFLLVAAVTAMWLYWQEHALSTDRSLIYNMGLTGGILMLIAFTYSLRKRLRFMRKSGSLVAWYYLHLLGGIVGPLLVIFHTTFTLRAINSTVALVAMLCVVVSGAFGRYIYTRIGYQLHHRLQAIRESERQLAEDMKRYRNVSTGGLERNLAKLTEAIISMQRSSLFIPLQLLTFRAKAASCYVRGSQELADMIGRQARAEGWQSAALKSEVAREKSRLREYIDAIVAISQLHLYERLLVGWRIFHIPLLFILLITGLVHVLAVHMY